MGLWEWLDIGKCLFRGLLQPGLAPMKHADCFLSGSLRGTHPEVWLLLEAFGDALSPTVSHRLPPSVTISHHLPPSPTVSHRLLPSPAISHRLPPSSTVSHHLPLSPTVSHHLPPSPAVSYPLPLSPAISLSSWSGVSAVAQTALTVPEHQFLSLASLEQGPHRDAVVPKVCAVRGHWLL